MINIPFWNRFQYPESIPVQSKNQFLLELELELESSISEKGGKSDSGIDSSAGIITPLFKTKPHTGMPL